MDFKLAKEQEQQLVHSVQRFLSEQFGEDVGTLKAALFLRFCLEEIGPCVYNRAIADAQLHLQNHLSDLENVCFAPEFQYWSPRKAHNPRGNRKP